MKKLITGFINLPKIVKYLAENNCTGDLERLAKYMQITISLSIVALIAGIVEAMFI